MRLSPKEKAYYESTYQKLISSKVTLDENTCLRLIQRGINDKFTCLKIWLLCSNDGKRKLLDKEDFFKLLKYIAAWQNGFKIDNIDIDQVEELSIPNLPKTKAKTNDESITENNGLISNSKPHRSTSTSNSNGVNEDNNNNNSGSMNEPRIKNEAYSHNEQLNSDPIPTNLNSNPNSNTIQIPFESQDQSSNKPAVSNLRDNYSSYPFIDTNTDIMNSNMSSNFNSINNIDNANANVSIMKEEIKSNYVKSNNAIDSTSMIISHNNNNNTDNDDYSYNNTNNNNNKDYLVVKEKDELLNSMTLINPFKDQQQQQQQQVMNGRKNSSQSNPSSRKTSKSGMNEVGLMNYSIYHKNQMKINISIKDTKYISSGLLGISSYNIYVIESTYLNDPSSSTSSSLSFKAERRYSDFDWLHNYFLNETQYKGLNLPALPEKAIRNTDPEFIEKRKKDLESYLRWLGAHEILYKDNILRSFLGDPTNQSFDKLKGSREYSKKFNFESFDVQNIANLYEYYKTKAYIKIKGEGDVDLFDGNMENESIQEIFRLELIFQRFYDLMCKKVDLIQSLYIAMPALDILNSNMAFTNKENPMCEPLSRLIDVTLQNMHGKTEELRNDEMLKQYLKIAYDKIKGFKRAYYMLIYNSEEICTQRELLHSKREKLMKLKLDQKDTKAIEMEETQQEKKIRDLEKENLKIKENLLYEIGILRKELSMINREMCESYFLNEKEGSQKMYEKSLDYKNSIVVSRDHY